MHLIFADFRFLNALDRKESKRPKPPLRELGMMTCCHPERASDWVTAGSAAWSVEILVKELDVPQAQLTSDARLIEDLGADSLTIVQIQLALEERFGLCIPDDRIEKMATVADVYELLVDLQTTAPQQ